MLEIRLCLEPEAIRTYCRKCGKAPGPQYYLYRAADKKRLLAAALFEVKSDRVMAIWYEGPEDDSWLFDAVLRAGLNYAAQQGIASGFLPEPFRQAHAALFVRLNYPAQAVFDITNFFAKYKRCAP